MTGSGRSSPAPSASTDAGRRSALREEPASGWPTARSSRACSRRSSASYDREPLLKRLEEADVPATPVNTVDQVMNDPQTAERGIDRSGSMHPEARRDPGRRHAAPLLAHEPGRAARRARCAASTPTRSSPSAGSRPSASASCETRRSFSESLSDGGPHHVRTTARTAFPRRRRRSPDGRRACRVPEAHFVNGNRLEPPLTRIGLELDHVRPRTASGAPSGNSGSGPGRMGNRRGLCRRPHAQSDLRGGLLPERTGHNEVVRVVFEPRVG